MKYYSHLHWDFVDTAWSYNFMEILRQGVCLQVSVIQHWFNLLITRRPQPNIKPALGKRLVFAAWDVHLMLT